MNLKPLIDTLSDGLKREFEEELRDALEVDDE